MEQRLVDLVGCQVTQGGVSTSFTAVLKGYRGKKMFQMTLSYPPTDKLHAPSLLQVKLKKSPNALSHSIP